MQININSIFVDHVGQDYLNQIKNIKALYSNKLREASIIQDTEGCYYIDFLCPKQSKSNIGLNSDTKASLKNKDKTSLECSENKIAIVDFINGYLAHHVCILQGLKYTFELAEKLQVCFPRTLFKVILSFQLQLDIMDRIMEELPNLPCLVSIPISGIDIGPFPQITFHKVREGEEYLLGNLNAYKVNGMLTIDTLP